MTEALVPAVRWPSQRVLWGEGMFLLPQHFQVQDRYWDHRLASLGQALAPFAWGLRSLRWDLDALEQGLLRLLSLEAVFPDGTLVTLPDGDFLPEARRLADIPELGTEARINLVLPLWNPYGPNLPSESSPHGWHRYAPQARACSDWMTEAQPGEVVTLVPHVRLRVGPEPVDGSLALEIGQLKRLPSGAWQLEEGFLGPTLELAGAPVLLALLRRLLDILHAKAEALAGTHRERVRSVVDFGASEVGSFWLQHVVHRSFPGLKHLLSHPKGHSPERLHLALSELAASLMTFSSRAHLVDLPDYQHEQPGPGFLTLERLIRDLLDTVVSDRFVVIPLQNPRPFLHVGHLEGDLAADQMDFYLGLSGDQPAAFFVEELPVKLKVGSPDDVEKILHSALPGIRLLPVSNPPSALPVRVGQHFLALERTGTIYERMLKARSICLYIPQTLPSFKMDLYALPR